MSKFSTTQEKSELIMELEAEDFKLMTIISIVSILCVGAFLLPLEIQDLLKVRHRIFNPLTYMTASFVHDDLLHLGLNLSVFILFAFLLYFANTKVGKQQFFFYSLLLMFVVLPLLNYGALFYFGIWESIQFGYGLSLAGSGLIGFTVPSMILFFRGRLRKFNSILFFTSMFLFTACLIIAPYNWMLFVLCAILGFVFGMWEFGRILRFMVKSFKVREKQMEAFILAFTLWFYFFSIISLFPANIVSQGGIIDIVSHYVGIIFGILPFSVYSISVHV